MFISCNKCSVSLRVPSNEGTIKVTCPKCHNIFYYQGNKATAQSSRSASHSTNRSIKIWRPAHVHKDFNLSGLNNRLKDAHPIHVYLDNEDKGILKTGDYLTIALDARPHSLKAGPLGQKCKLPA